MIYIYVWVLFENNAQKKAENVISVFQNMFRIQGKTKTEASHAFGSNFQLNSHAITAGEMLRKLCFCFTPLRLHPHCSSVSVD